MEFPEVIFDRKDSGKPDGSTRLPYQYVENLRLPGQKEVKDLGQELSQSSGYRKNRLLLMHNNGRSKTIQCFPLLLLWGKKSLIHLNIFIPKVLKHGTVE